MTANKFPSNPQGSPLGGSLVGSHVSTAGGLERTITRLEQIPEANTAQIFTAQPNRWTSKALTEDSVRAWREGVLRLGYEATVVHDSYLISLGSPDQTLWQKSLAAYVEEMKRCVSLGITYLVSHPGNAMSADRPAALVRNARGITEMLESVPGDTILCLECTAGGGTVLGCRFEELARLLELVPDHLRNRVGCTFDMCHAYSAGYDLVNEYDSVWEEWERIIGLESLKVLHLNDSKNPYGSRKDRHEQIGSGTLGEGPFRRIMNDPRFVRMPKIIETPKDEDEIKSDRRALSQLREFIVAS